MTVGRGDVCYVMHSVLSVDFDIDDEKAEIDSLGWRFCVLFMAKLGTLARYSISTRELSGTVEKKPVPHLSFPLRADYKVMMTQGTENTF